MLKKLKTIYFILNDFIKSLIPGKITPKIEIIFFSLIFIVFSFLFYNITRGNWFPNTDNIQNYVFSEQFAKHNNLVIKNDLNEEFKPAIFGLRGMIIKNDGSAVPTSTLGYIVLMGLVRKISDFLIFFINPALAVLSLFYLYKISQLVFYKDETKKISFTIIFLASILAPFLFTASVPFNNIAATAFFIASFYFLCKIIFTQDKAFSFWNLFSTSAFAGLGIWMRLDLISFLFPAILLLFIRLFKKEQRINLAKNIKNIFLALIPFIISALILAFVNFKLYGNYLGPYGFLGTQLNYYPKEELLSRIGFEGSSFWIFPPNAFSEFITGLKNQIFLVNPFISIFFVISLVFILKEDKKIKPILTIIFLIILFQLWFYLSKAFSGSNLSGSVGSSASRYLLSSWLLMTILAVYSVYKIFNLISQRIRLEIILGVLIVVYAIFNLNVFLNSPLSYNYFIRMQKTSSNYHKQINKNTSEKSVIYCILADRYIYPFRQTAIYPSIPKNKWHEELDPQINNLLKAGYQIYFADESKKENDAVSNFLKKDKHIGFDFAKTNLMADFTFYQAKLKVQNEK